MSAISLQELRVVRGEKVVLHVDALEVVDGELLVVLGPSGAGKSTLLRAIAGLDPIETGSVLIGGDDMAGISTRLRGVAMVFQDQALYPTLNVRDNIAFPLKIRKTHAAEVDSRVEAEARVLEIAHLLERKPGELGSGHQQLVQAARALVRVPAVFLMDEPFSRLDAKLRTQMRHEFRLLQQGYAVTTVFVTNDQQEAILMADRIAVLRDGMIQQVAAPMELYHQPAGRFVAGFIGAMGIVVGQLSADQPGYWLSFGDFRIRAWTPALASHRAGPVDVGVRPEDVCMDSAGVAVNVGDGYFVGSYGMAKVEISPRQWVEMRTPGPPPTSGTRVRIRLRRLHIFDPRTGKVVGQVEDGAG